MADIYIISGVKSQPVDAMLRRKPRVATNNIGLDNFSIIEMINLLSQHSGARIGSVAITADSTPDFDNWGWDDYWNCNDWMNWHALNVQQYGLQIANQKFTQAWASQDIWMAPYNWCKYHSDFADYFSAQGIDTGWLFSHLLVAAENVGDNVINVVTNTGKGVQMIGTLIKYALPVAAVGAGAYGIYELVQHTKTKRA